MVSPPTGRCCGGSGLTPGVRAFRVDPLPFPAHTFAMPAFLALLVVLASLGVSGAQGQADYYARLGVTFATKLVIDNIVQDIETKQSLAPTLALGAALPISPSYLAGLEATLTTSGLHSSEANQETDLGTVRTGSIVLGLEGPVAPHVSWRAGLGLIQ